jgi:hypothetical protein
MKNVYENINAVFFSFLFPRVKKSFITKANRGYEKVFLQRVISSLVHFTYQMV